jgi:hypothetical protein
MKKEVEYPSSEDLIRAFVADEKAYQERARRYQKQKADRQAPQTANLPQKPNGNEAQACAPPSEAEIKRAKKRAWYASLSPERKRAIASSESSRKALEKYYQTDKYKARMRARYKKGKGGKDSGTD